MLIKFRKKNKTGSSPKQSAQSVFIQDKAESPRTVKGFDVARKLIKAVPDVRDEKVAQIKKQIENGTYKIDGEKIALKMIKESLMIEKP